MNEIRVICPKCLSKLLSIICSSVFLVSVLLLTKENILHDDQRSLLLVAPCPLVWLISIICALLCLTTPQRRFLFFDTEVLVLWHIVYSLLVVFLSLWMAIIVIDPHMSLRHVLLILMNAAHCECPKQIILLHLWTKLSYKPEPFVAKFDECCKWPKN